LCVEVGIQVPVADKSTAISEPTPKALDQEQAALAHSIIEALLDHTRVVSDLIALMAQALDQDTTKALTLTPVWQAYLESRRKMEKTRADVEKFAQVIPQPSDRSE